jgi:trypsin
MFDYIRKAPISLGDAVLDGTTVFITGFGTTTLGGRSDRYLYRTAVKIVNQQQCANNYLNVFSLITNRMICAAAPGRDSCQG